MMRPADLDNDVFPVGQRLDFRRAFALVTILLFLLPLLLNALPLWASPDLIEAQFYPPDPLANIPWSAGFGGVEDVETAFNRARSAENSQLNTHMPQLEMPDEAFWAGMNAGERVLWLANAERTARGLAPFHGVDPNVFAVAQAYAEWLLANNKSSHEDDGSTPWERLDKNPTINACHDFLGVAENIYVSGTTRSDGVPLVIEQAVYSWLYDDDDPDVQKAWGHRHALLWNNFTENSDPADREGLIGVGHARGPFLFEGRTDLLNTDMIVMNMIDPCPNWAYVTPPEPEPVTPPQPEPEVEPIPETRTISGETTLPVWTTVAAQQFEPGTWPGLWEVSDANGSQHGEYHWAARTCQVFDGVASGMAVGGGADGSSATCDGSYPNNVRSWMIYGPFDLTGAIAAELYANVWVHTEPDYDMLCLLASMDKNIFNGPCVSGNSNGWVEEMFDLNQVYRMGSLLGRRQLYVALAFITDESETRPQQGVYVDDVLLRKAMAPAATGAQGVDEAIPLYGVTVNGAGERPIMTGQDGSFTIPNLPPDVYRIVPSKAGYQFYPPFAVIDVTQGDGVAPTFVGTTSIHMTTYLPVIVGGGAGSTQSQHLPSDMQAVQSTFAFDCTPGGCTLELVSDR